MISLDVEGYERFVIQGAIKTIKKCKPLIVCERGIPICILDEAEVSYR